MLRAWRDAIEMVPGYDPAMSEDPEGALFAAIDTGDGEKVRRLVAADAGLAAARNANGVSAILHALYRGRRPLAEMLADARPALDVFEAAGLGRAAALETLLGADPSLAADWSADGFTALHFAAFFGGDEAAAALVAAGADPDLRSHNDFSVMPLHSAAAGAHSAVVAILLDAGADPNVRQPGGFTPLHGAAQNDDDASAERLLAAGADPAAATDDGRTPDDLAREAGHAGLADRLAAARGR